MQQVTLPVAITPRDGHCAAVFGSGPGFRVVVLFGGSTSVFTGDEISETTLLLLEFKSRTFFRSASCRVTRVVEPCKLGRPDERLREQMRKLELSSQEALSGHKHLYSSSTGVEQSMREEKERSLRTGVDGRVQLPKGKVADFEQLVQDSTQQAHSGERNVAEEWEEKMREMEGRWREAENRATEAEKRSAQIEKRLNEMEGRLKEEERRAREMEARLREAKQTTKALQHQLEQKEDPFWMVERNEIYLTEWELGRGGWATVKVAKFRGLEVAAKCLHSIISDYNRQLFVREMNIAAKLRHPNLVQFIGATLEGEPVILTELMTTSLRAVLETASLSAANIISISCDIARALNYLHLTKPDPIMHRDVSSANVLLNLDPNKTWLAKLSDYGSANFVHQVTTAGPGNPAYAAPEASNPSLQSLKMDVYSYGILLVEMATRRFPDKSTLNLQIQHIEVPELPGIIQQCVQDNPARRPNMRDLLTQLLEIHT